MHSWAMPMVRGELRRLGHFGLGDGGRDAGDGEGAVAEDVVSHGGDERGVDAAREGDDGGRDIAHDLVQTREFLLGGDWCSHGSK